MLHLGRMSGRKRCCHSTPTASAAALKARRYSTRSHTTRMEYLRQEKQRVLPLIKNAEVELCDVDVGLTDDTDVVLAAVNVNGWAVYYASPRFRGDREIVLTAVSRIGCALQYVTEELRGDKEIVLAAVTQDGLAIEYATDEMLRDREVVMRAMNLKFAAVYFGTDKEVVMALMCEADASYFKFVSEQLRNDKEVVMAAVLRDPDCLEFASEQLRNDKDIVMATVANSELESFVGALQFASETLRDDKDIVMAAVNTEAYIVQYASKRLKNDKEIAMAVVTQDGDSLVHVSEELRGDQDIVIAAVAQNEEALRYVSNKDNIFSDFGFATKLVGSLRCTSIGRTMEHFPKLASKLGCCLRKVNDFLQHLNSFDALTTTSSAEEFSDLWLSGLSETQPYLSARLPSSVANYVLEFYRIEKDLELATEIKEYAPFLDALMDRRDKSFMEMARRYVNWYDQRHCW